MSKQDGGPAFPITLFEGQTLGDGTANGMTLRDYFAAKAMALSPHNVYEYECNAAWAYKFADAMLAARNKE